jgi:hypothetical protein
LPIFQSFDALYCGQWLRRERTGKLEVMLNLADMLGKPAQRLVRLAYPAVALAVVWAG